MISFSTIDFVSSYIDHLENQQRSLMNMEQSCEAITLNSVLDEMLVQAHHLILYYSMDIEMSRPKAGFEKEWKIATKKRDLLTTISRIVNAYDYAPALETRERVNHLVDRVLSHSAIISVDEGDGTMLINIADGIERKRLASLIFKRYADSLILHSYHLME